MRSMRLAILILCVIWVYLVVFTSVEVTEHDGKKKEDDWFIVPAP